MYAIAIAALAFVLLSVFYQRRTPVAILAAGALVLVGEQEGFFTVKTALSRIPAEVLILLLVLSMFSKVFERTGVLYSLGVKAATLAGGRRYVTVAFLLFAVFAFSLLANNLSVILVLTLVCLRLGSALRLPTIPLLVGTVIASNIGGCPLPWADTPAIVLTTHTDFDITDFLEYVLPPCALLIGLLILYSLGRTTGNRTTVTRLHELINLESIGFLAGFERTHWRSATVPAVIFFGLIAGISLAPLHQVPVAYVAAASGALLLLVEGRRAADLLDIPGFIDMSVFISALFLIGGTLEASQVLAVFAKRILTLATVHDTVPLLGVLGLSFAVCTFLSAGPAAITLLPVCSELVPLYGKVVYAALALGVLAGSSMLPWSATGGPAMLNEASRFLRNEGHEYGDPESLRLLSRFRSYIGFSVPFSFVMLIVSAIWLYAITR